MKRLTPPAGHIGCIVILICAASMLSRAQSPYLPIPNGEWDRIITLDTAFIRISYEMTFRDALPYSTSEPDALMITDTRMVEIGTKCRKDYSYILETAEQENKKLTEKGILPNAGCPPVRPFEMFIYDGGKITVSYRTLMHGPILKFEDICESMQWSLTGEADQVGDYQCQKAVTSFGGRKWTAWFCPDIPVDGGPYKFCGLPGLILKVEDSETRTDPESGGLRKAFLMDHDRNRERLVAHLRETVPLSGMQSQGSRKDPSEHVSPSVHIHEERRSKNHDARRKRGIL